MDTATCYTVIALLAALSGTLLYLLRRAATRPIGEVRPVVALPPMSALAEDLHDTFRRACPMTRDGVIPDDLPACSPEWAKGWIAVAQRVRDHVAPLPPGATRIGPAVQVPLRSVAALVALGLCACGPTALDRARGDLTSVLRVQSAAVARLQSGDAACQQRLVSAAGNRERAVAQLAAYRDRRKAVLTTVAETTAATDEAADQVLLSDRGASEAAIAKARAAAAKLRDQVAALVEGC